MHYQRSSYALKLLRMGAYHFLFNLILGPVALVLAVVSAYWNLQTWLYAGLAALSLWVFSLLVFYVKGSAFRCALCMTPLWVGRKCQKHKKAKRAFGLSYRLTVALSVVFTGKYRCPYCGEPFSAKKVRGESRHQH